MISVDEAKATIRQALSPLPAETVPLAGACGRVLAEPVQATISQPPFSSSAMDGYAVRLEDARRKGARLKLIGISSAGERFTGALTAGAAVRIFTGAPVPPGADHVLIQEHTERCNDEIVVAKEQEKAQNIRPLGVDFNAGATLIASGTTLTGPALALAAAGNVQNVGAARRPRVALIANGDELIMPGETPGPDEIICSIPFGLCPMIERWGGDAAFLGIAPDNLESIRTLVEQARTYDLIVPIGGASVGDRDFMRAAFSEAGFAPVFEKVSVKPGKPVWFSQSGDTAVLGLPGNPASALVTAILFLRIALARLLGLPDNETDRLASEPAALPLPENGPRESYLRARLVDGPGGTQAVAPFDNQDSSLLSVMAQSDVLVRRAAHAPAIEAGDMVECLKV